MIPVQQTLFSNHDNDITGDCLRACICSLLHLKIDDVPHFITYKPQSKWYDFLQEWIHGRGYTLHYDCEQPDTEYYMVWGISPRGIQHAVIHSKGKLVHDPHPEGGDVTIGTYVWLEEVQ